MFGLSVKDKVREAIIKATNVILVGSFFHHSTAKQSGLNDSATAYLYSEAQVHQMAVLIMVFMGTVGKRNSWATLQFLYDGLVTAFAKWEKQNNLPSGQLNSFFTPHCAEILKIPPDLRSNGQHFRESAAQVKKLDPKADEKVVVKQLADCSQEYYAWAMNVFEC